MTTAGIGVAILPVREGAKVLSHGLFGSTLTRNCWRGNGRAWIEVRGLDGPRGGEPGPAPA